MKIFNFSITPSSLFKTSLFKKMIAVFFLSILFQGESTCGGSTSSAKAEEDIENKNDKAQVKVIISDCESDKLPEYLQSRCGPTFIKPNLKHILYNLVNQGKCTRLKIVLEYCRAININEELQTALTTYYTSAHNKTLLGIAIVNGRPDIVDLLIEQGIDIEKKTHDRTPLSLVFKEGGNPLKFYNKNKSVLIANKLIDLLKEKNPQFLCKKNEESTFLDAAVENKFKEATEKLLHFFKDKKPELLYTKNKKLKMNTPLHSIIKNEWEEPAMTLINFLESENPQSLYEKNEEGNTPLHSLALAKGNLKKVEDKLISKLPEEKIWITNNEDQTALDILMKNGKDQERIKESLRKIHLERLTEKNKKGDTLLHRAATLSLSYALEIMVQRIKKSENNKAVNQLFQRNKEGNSVWICMVLPSSNYLSFIGLQNNTDINMFKKIIKLLENILTKEDRERILGEISNQQKKPLVKRKISQSYANTLFEILNQQSGNNKNKISHPVPQQKHIHAY